MDIYWIKDKKKCGPATVPDVVSLVQMEELTPQTLGWHAGCAKWTPLAELPALADFLNPREPEPEEPVAESEAEQGGMQDTLPDVPEKLPEGAIRIYMPTPTMRFLARFVDVSLYMALIFTAYYMREQPYSAGLLPSNPLFWLAMLVIEAALLNFFGTTPGKALFGIRIGDFGSQQPMNNLGFGRAFMRAFMAFVGGLGMMVSFLPVIMCGFSWWQLRRKGITFWDARVGSLPMQRGKVSRVRHFVAIILILVCMNIVSACMQPWLPDMIAEIQLHSPEAAQMLQQMLPPQPPVK